MTVASPNTVRDAILAVRQEARKHQKDQLNPRFENRYVGLPTVMEAILPVIYNHGLLLVQVMDHVGDTPSIRTQLIHVATGEMIEGNCPLQLDGTQGIGSAVTYYQRYALMSLLGLIADENDDDGQRARTPATVQAVSGVDTSLPVAQADPFPGGVVEFHDAC
jgi:ERF superfamily